MTDDLAALLADIGARLSRAVADRRAAWRTPVVASLDSSGAPTARVMVLRAFDPTAWRCDLHTDARSAKTIGLERDPRAALTFWDPKANLQLRLAGLARLREDHAAWRALSDGARATYAVVPAPGAPIPTSDGYALGDRDAAAAQFRVLEFTPTAIDWLHLAAEGHHRAAAARSDPASPWRATWVAP